jgi:hypothetical protein
VRPGRRYLPEVVSQDPPPPDERPEFGPSGYLPERASKRARKIVLRAPLGLQWPIAAVLAGLAVVVAGVLFLRGDDAPPPEPWVAVGEAADIGAAQPLEELDALLVGAGGRLRAFADASDVGYCEPSNRLESDDGRVWSLTGRGLGGTASLAEHPSLIQGGTAYLDPSRTIPGPPPSDDDVDPACR